MRIKRMTATFGSLDHETLELEEGLNILTLPNEGGKSTWCAFLRVMLYGLNTRERTRRAFWPTRPAISPGAARPWRGTAVLLAQQRHSDPPLSEGQYAPGRLLRPFMPTPAHRWPS